MKKFCLLLVVLFNIPFLIAQKISNDYTLDWLREKDKRTIKFEPYDVFKTDDGYLSIETEVIHGPGGYRYYTVKRDNNFNIVKIINISDLIDEKKYFVEKIFRFGEKLVVATSRNFNKERKKESYIQLIDPNTGQISERKRICSVSFERKPRRLEIGFLESPNEEKLLVFFDYPTRRNDEQLIGFQLFDKNIKSLWKKEKISMKVDDAHYQILDYALNDSGEVYMLGKNLKDAKLRPTFYWGRGFGAKFKTENNIEPFEILSFKDEKLISNAIKIQEIGLINFDISVGKDNVLHGIGYFSETPKGNIVSGVLTAIVDGSTGELIKVNRKLFGPEMMKEGLSVRAKQKIDKRVEKGKEIGYNYKLRIKGTIQHQDGTISFVGEEFYVVVRTVYNAATGSTTTDYDYVYGDLVIARISSDGTITSISKIRKYHKYETAPVGHSVVFGLNNQLVAIFSDSRKFYFDKEDFKNLDGKLKRDRKILTIASVDKNGSVKREALVDYCYSEEHQKDGEYRMDKDAFVLSNGRKIILYTRYRGREHGYLVINPKD